jgi:ATP-dependent Clp protease ATP-binding subunit ClpB
VNIQLKELKDKLLKKEISLHVTSDAFEPIATIGFDPFFGARPVKRVIQREVLNELSKALLSGKINDAKKIVMDVFDGKIVFRKPVLAEEEV